MDVINSQLDMRLHDVYPHFRDLLNEVLAMDGCMVAFMSNNARVDQLERVLEERLSVITMTGTMSPEERAAAVDLWNTGEHDLFVTTYFVGVVGVNLNVKNGRPVYLALVDPPPRLADGLQARARIDRP